MNNNFAYRTRCNEIMYYDTHIILYNYLEHLLERIPNHITHLKFDYFYNNFVDFLPHSLKSLKFSYHFNKHIDNLPLMIEYLTLGEKFNQIINNLPPSLKYLRFNNKKFNHIIPVPYKFVILDNQQQFNDLMPFLPNVIDITTHQNYINNNDITNLEELWIYDNMTNLVDYRIKNKIKYIN